MRARTTCPAADEYHRFLNGVLSPDQMDELASHLEECPECVEFVSGMRDDTLAEAVRVGSTLPEDPEKQRVGELMDRVMRLRAMNLPLPPEGTQTIDSGPPPSGGYLPGSTEDMELERLNGYRIERVLGVGGMGKVYLAEDEQLKRQVALKVMKPDIAAKPLHRQRFLREAQAAAAVEHDHVIPIFQVGEDDGVPFLAMPLLKGESLEDRLKRERKLSSTEVIRIGKEIAEGLAAAHEKGLIHRDIKPSNVWLEEQSAGRGKPRDRVKILDFGLARAAEDDVRLTQSGAIIGTPAYMSPEQANAQRVDVRTDLFSLGSVLYHMLTGHRPFPGESTTAILINLTVENPTPPNQLDRSVPSRLSDLVMRLLEKSSDARPPSAADVADELAEMEQQIDEDTIPFATEVPEEKPLAVSSRSRRGWALMSLVGLGLVAGIVVALMATGVIRVQTPKGTLVIEGVDEDVEVIVRQNGAELHDKLKGRRFDLEVGEYTIELAEKGDGLRLNTDKFTITRGENTPIRVYLERQVVKKPMPPGGEKNQGAEPDKIDADRRAAEWVLSINGSLTIVEDGKSLPARTRNDLPAGSFHITKIELERNDLVKDADLEKLQGLSELHSLNLFRTGVSDAGLEHIGKNHRIQMLYLANTDVGDAGLAHLKNLRTLEMLTLANTRVTDAGLAHLRGHPTLTSLTLERLPITHVGLDHLSTVTSLKSLSLRRVAVTDTGLEKIALLTNLRELEIPESKVTDAGMAHFKGMTKLENLNLARTQITDEGLAHLKELTQFEALSLWNTKVTDAGLKYLKSSRNLQSLNLLGTGVSSDGVKELAAALPNCRIGWDGGVVGPE